MSQEAIDARCVVCELKSKSRCARCRNVYYCSKEHQHEDWKRHRSECKKDKKVKNVTADSGIDIHETSTTSDSADTNPASALKHRGNCTKGVTNELESSPTNVKVSSENIENKQLPVSSKKSDTEQSIKDISAKLREESVTSRVVHTDKESSGAGAITYEGSSENEILSASTQQITSTEHSKPSVNVLKAINRTDGTMLAMPSFSIEAPPKAIHSHKEYPEASLRGNVAPFSHNKNSFVMENNDPYFELCQRVIRDMSVYGVCVLDNFLGRERGKLVLNEVLEMYKLGIFQAGQLVSTPGSTEAKTIRSDEITWINGKETHCFYIGNLIQQVDNIILRANKMSNNGKMGDFTINGRTKIALHFIDPKSVSPSTKIVPLYLYLDENNAMVACYPGFGSHYVKHVDNPNKDGRCITAIYYLNLDWDVTRNGGLLRVFPEGQHQVADIAPIFDRMLFFWSDRRNPHEVQPSFNTRYAITLWYFDAQEREDATRRFHEKHTRTPATSK